MTRSRVSTSTRRARDLRRRMTEAEALVLNEVRRRQFGCRIRRQEPIGPFVVDFVCKRHRWILEIDGSQHNGSVYDLERDRWLRANWYRILRIWNQEVLADLEMNIIASHVGKVG